MHHLIAAMGVSQRFACRVTGQNRTIQRHQRAAATPADPDAGLRTWLRQYAKDHPRRGFRPAYHDARAEGWMVNHKRLYRPYRDEGLRRLKRRRRHLSAADRERQPAGTAPNALWSMDIVSRCAIRR